jgi:ribonuclease HI
VEVTSKLVNHGLSNLDPAGGIGLFTDGSADYKDRSGGWAWLAIDTSQDGYEAFDMGGTSDTTNNRMEMTAWTEGLNAIYAALGPCTVVVYSDSQYVGFGSMDRSRKRNNNVDLWLAIDEAVDRHWYVEFRHIKGHNDHHYNEQVDRLAGEARLAWQSKAS